MPAAAHKEPLKPGVKTPGVQLPLSKLGVLARYQVPGSPDWIAIEKHIWISNKPKNSVSELDPGSDRVLRTITGFNKPCSGLALGFGSLWVPNCGDQTLSRVDLESGKITASFPVGVADSEGGLTTGYGKVWILTDKSSTLAQVDPNSNQVTAKLQLPKGCYNATYGFDAVWVSCTERNSVVRVNPKTNAISAQIKVGPQPRFLTAGEGAVWTLNQGDGSVTRIDPKTARVIASIQVGIPGPGGDISAAEGSVWATAMGLPVSRIDPKTNQVVRQFVGKGGDAIRAGRGMLVLSNYMAGDVWRMEPDKL
jgi:YVTN family beta-propeller protein